MVIIKFNLNKQFKDELLNDSSKIEDIIESLENNLSEQKDNVIRCFLFYFIKVLK